MRLHVGVLGAEQLARTLTGDLFYDVHTLAAAVVALARIALGILVGKMAAHCRHNGRCDDVFTGDQLQIAALSFQLLVHCLADCGIVLLQIFQSSDICQFTHVVIPLCT